MALEALQRVNSALQAGDFSALAGHLDDSELCSPSPTVLEEGWPAALHLLAHIYNGTLPDARMLYKRLPASVKDDPQVAAAWRLLQHAWQGNSEGLWRALRSHPWSGPTQTLAEALAERFRSRQLDLVAAAYSHITPSRLAALCGCSEGEAVAAGQARGWRLLPAEGAGSEAVGACLEVVSPAVGRGELDSLEALKHLSVTMMALE